MCFIFHNYILSTQNHPKNKQSNQQLLWNVDDPYSIIMVSKKLNTVEPLYNEVLGTMKITLLYQVSHYIRVKKQRNIKSWDQQNYLVIRGFCYIRPRYNEVPLYLNHYSSSHLLIP